MEGHPDLSVLLEDELWCQGGLRAPLGRLERTLRGLCAFHLPPPTPSLENHESRKHMIGINNASAFTVSRPKGPRREMNVMGKCFKADAVDPFHSPSSQVSIRHKSILCSASMSPGQGVIV